MPTITVQSEKSFDVKANKRLVLALEDNGIDILHRCRGNARCTTCRVAFSFGEPDLMTAAEYAKLLERGLLGEYRLSCQIVCSHDMSVNAPMTMRSETWPDPGPPPDPEVQPEAAWYPRADLERQG